MNLKNIDITICNLGEYANMIEFVKNNNLEKEFKKEFNEDINNFKYYDMTDEDYIDILLNKYFKTEDKRYFTTYLDNSDIFIVDYVYLKVIKEVEE